MAHDKLALEHLGRVLDVATKAGLQHHSLDIASEFLARRQVGLADAEDSNSINLCDTCLHSLVCTTYGMSAPELQIKVASCRAHLPEPVSSEQP